MTDVRSTVVAQVVNKSGREIYGSDYSVVLHSDMEGPVVVNGKDIAPNATVYLSGRFPAEGAARQTYTANVKFNITPSAQNVYKYYEVKGGEYDEYRKTK